MLEIERKIEKRERGKISEWNKSSRETLNNESQNFPFIKKVFLNHRLQKKYPTRTGIHYSLKNEKNLTFEMNQKVLKHLALLKHIQGTVIQSDAIYSIAIQLFYNIVLVNSFIKNSFYTFQRNFSKFQ